MFSSLGAAAFVATFTQPLATQPCNHALGPTQIRLAYAGDNGMAVSWNTNRQLTKPTVYYNKHEKKVLKHFATSKISTTYPTSSTYNNHVISDLKPDTTSILRVV
ncbi:hypothetical protein GMDG_07390 [Pseudogymnoascus destructans 20631-21]|uniref:Purple acid phosphatase N-terminal domain-containing protein n=1 Tax=Pseudogymnoascus destructans (strain ATCC MYA-4855 / 20631-21) TaxID=658429 RepID=L8FYA7_PSED2|nr:hypothetical protein GMDG_07390 [Pseudogymnoascus destructans 20631-21]